MQFEEAACGEEEKNFKNDNGFRTIEVYCSILQAAFFIVITSCELN